MIAIDEIKKTVEDTGKFWISFTGDSITSCEWVHPNWREIVEYVLKEELTKALNGDWKTSEWGIRTFNFAYDGSTTRDILERIDKVLIIKPDLVIGLMGGNDPDFNVPIDESVKNVHKIAEKVIESGAKLIWSTSTPEANESEKNFVYQPYAKALLNSFNTDKNLQFIDMYSLYQKFPFERIFTFKEEDGSPDLEHPNQLGNAYIAKVILKEVFDIEFDPEKYIRTTLEGEKNPKY